MHWRVPAWLAACPGDKDLLGSEKPCVEFFSLEKAGGGGKGSGFFAQLDLRRNALWEGSSLQTRNAASFQCSAALWVLQLGRAAEGQRPLQGGALLSPCPWLWPSTTGFSLRRLWAGRGSRERWFLLQSDEGLAGLEALSRMAGRGQTGGGWTSSVWATKPPSPWHQRSLLGTIVPSLCWWLVGGW